MKTRLDRSFESWGGFRLTDEGSPHINGLLRYEPKRGLELQLAENPWGSQSPSQLPQSCCNFFGTLIDGTLVSLARCYVSNASLQMGIGIGSPTTMVVNEALFGWQLIEWDEQPVNEYSLELSSLADWTCAPGPDFKMVNEPRGFDVGFRLAESIVVPLPKMSFDVHISHNLAPIISGRYFSTTSSAAIKIIAHGEIPLKHAREAAVRCKQLMSLLVGHELSERFVTLSPSSVSGIDAPHRPLNLVYKQRGKHDHEDEHPALMLLPYDLVRDRFTGMVEAWFSRNDQAVLAANVFFGSQYAESPSVDVRFLFAVFSTEAYHRSLGTGLYMNQDDYAKAVESLASQIPPAIQSDHRRSLVNRLKYGNEWSLRKRLTEMLNRVPGDVQRGIAGDVEQFVKKVVDTRNYLTHYDQSAKANAFSGMDMYVASQRIRILVIANLLKDLGLDDSRLLKVLKRSAEFNHWMAQNLPL